MTPGDNVRGQTKLAAGARAVCKVQVKLQAEQAMAL